MGWIKAEVDETTHETIRREADALDKPIHELSAELLQERLEQSDTYMKVAWERDDD